MTENEAILIMDGATREEYLYMYDASDRPYLIARAENMALNALKEIQQYRAIGTVDEFKALKEKNTPQELAEHNFQDEVHHYLCPSCRNIVSCTQNYCEECGQALEI